MGREGGTGKGGEEEEEGIDEPNRRSSFCPRIRSNSIIRRITRTRSGEGGGERLSIHSLKMASQTTD